MKANNENKMEMMIVPETIPQFSNSQLNMYTTTIFAALGNVKKNLLKTAAVLAKIDETKCYEDDGFKSAADYAQKTLGIGKSQVYNILAVGRSFVDQCGESLLQHPKKRDYNVYQLMSLLPAKKYKEYTIENAFELTEDGTITPFMTASEISAELTSRYGEPDTSDDVSDNTDIADVDEYAINYMLTVFTSYDCECVKEQKLIKNIDELHALIDVLVSEERMFTLIPKGGVILE